MPCIAQWLQGMGSAAVAPVGSKDQAARGGNRVRQITARTALPRTSSRRCTRASSSPRRRAPLVRPTPLVRGTSVAAAPSSATVRAERRSACSNVPHAATQRLTETSRELRYIADTRGRRCRRHRCIALQRGATRCNVERVVSNAVQRVPVAGNAFRCKDASLCYKRRQAALG